MYIYQADVWCDDCGEAICKRLHTTSDDYPQHYSDDEESDTPQHCASGEDCLNAIELATGKVGYLFGELTKEGVEYVKEAIAEGGVVAELWKEHYADYL